MREVKLDSWDPYINYTIQNLVLDISVIRPACIIICANKQKRHGL